jgi:hypothetical protein
MEPVQPMAHGGSRRASQIVLAVLGAAVAAGLVWLSASTHLQRACLVLDTPYLPLCSDAAPKSDSSRRQDLRARIRKNPGDSGSWVSLANIESGPSQLALLPAIAALAPSDPNSLRLRVREALVQKQIPAAVALLVQMTDHGIAGDEPPHILARLIASGTGAALLRPHLVAGSRWLPPVLASMAALKLPLELAFPLLAEGAAKRVVAQDTVRSFVRSLKADGKWVDAYGLWVAQQRQPVPILFNGGFEQRFQSDGFDWEVTPSSLNRAGVYVTQRNMGAHGLALEIQYTGWAVPTPVIRQYLFVPAGQYSLQGQYMTSKLRMEQGLAWAVRCTGGAQTLASRSNPLQDTANAWKNFRFEFTVPAGCGMAVSLQLETFAPFEAATGFRGKAWFDGFEMRRLGAVTP